MMSLCVCVGALVLMHVDVSVLICCSVGPCVVFCIHVLKLEGYNICVQGDFQWGVHELQK